MVQPEQGGMFIDIEPTKDHQMPPLRNLPKQWALKKIPAVKDQRGIDLRFGLAFDQEGRAFRRGIRFCDQFLGAAGIATSSLGFIGAASRFGLIASLGFTRLQRRNQSKSSQS